MTSYSVQLTGTTLALERPLNNNTDDDDDDDAFFEDFDIDRSCCCTCHQGLHLVVAVVRVRGIGLIYLQHYLAGLMDSIHTPHY